MAIEATFRITDPGVFWTLQTIDHLAQYRLSAPKILEIDDTYLDTKKRRLLAAGYSCRRRDLDEGSVITLLKLESTKKETKKPKIWKVALAQSSNDHTNWPKSKVRSRVRKVISDKKLRVIFRFHQSRITRRIYLADRFIAEANLDSVSLTNKGKEHHFKTLKLRIASHKQEKHLKDVIVALHTRWSLETEPYTKFERIIALERGK
jgi:inorganic triphosphatase YgiF